MSEQENVVRIGEHLREKRIRQAQPAIAAQLRELAEDVAFAKDDDRPRSMLIVTLHDDGPYLITIGSPTWDDLRHASWALQDAYSSKHDPEMDMPEAVRRGHEKRMEKLEELRAEEAAKEQGLLAD